jgi:pyroglutamyl-peptidase
MRGINLKVASKTVRKTVRCVVTGFDPFAGSNFNPSQEIVEMLPDSLEIGRSVTVSLEKVVLPTCSEDSWKKLSSVLRRTSGEPVLVVMTGLAESRREVNLERVALNLRDYRIKDNCGNKGRARKVNPRAENALFTELPLEQVANALKRQGFPVTISNHAGTFVCNELYFRALQYAKTHGNVVGTLFVHVPLPENLGRKTSSESSKEPASLTRVRRLKGLVKLTSALEVAIGTCARKTF